MTTMRAAILHGKEDVRVESVPVPELQSGDLLVRVAAALTCGTDVKVFRRGYHARMITPPAVFGHEFAGTVEIGNARFQKGQRVVAANSAPCGACFFCARGQENLCENLLFNNGAYAEFIRIPARIADKNTHVIPDNVSFQSAALVEPLACALKGIDDCAVRPGDTVAVIGAGPLGLLLIKVAKLRCARVISVVRRAEQAARATQLGADASITSNHTEALKAMTDGRGADITIDAAGSPETWELAVNLVRAGGTVNFFGGPPSGTRVTLDTNRLHYSEITCKASFHHTPAHVNRALDTIAKGEVLAADLVEREASLNELPRILAELATASRGMKTAILP